LTGRSGIGEEDDDEDGDENAKKKKGPKLLNKGAVLLKSALGTELNQLTNRNTGTLA